jgi:hypothetical protein
MSRYSPFRKPIQAVNDRWGGLLFHFINAKQIDSSVRCLGNLVLGLDAYWNFDVGYLRGEETRNASL